LKPILLASVAMLALGACTTARTSQVRAVEDASVMAQAEPPPPQPCPPIRCSPHGPAPMAACRRSTRSGRTCSRKPAGGHRRPARRIYGDHRQSEAPTFQNTIEAGERAGQLLGRVLAVYGVMTGNMTNPQYQALQREWSPKLSAAGDEIVLNPSSSSA
jgi:hypothetical protein